MAEKMTLERVRDLLRHEHDTNDGKILWTSFGDMADAITPHLAQPSQAALYARCEDCSEPTGKTAVCITCAELRCDSVLRAAQAVDVGAIREVIAYLKIGHRFDVDMADKLIRAIGNAQADGWKVPEGCIPVPRSIVERWASVDAFNAPVGAAMELKTVAAQMLIHADMITAPPQPEE